MKKAFIFQRKKVCLKSVVQKLLFLLKEKQTNNERNTELYDERTSDKEKSTVTRKKYLH